MAQKRSFLESFFDECCPEHPLLMSVDKWVKVGIGRRLRSGKVTLISAVCPDYERRDETFTYASMQDGVPYTAAIHLEIVALMWQSLQQHNIELDYHITLADTEFDLPEVVNHLCGGDQQEFIRRCQSSCDLLKQKAEDMGIPLLSCQRFTDVFIDWFEYYHKALQIVEEECQQNQSRSQDVQLSSVSRRPLYQAMANRPVSHDYCEQMVKRQLAQYMTWSACACNAFSRDLVLMNHMTPNLSMINHQAFRPNQERIPIIKLDINTVPSS